MKQERKKDTYFVVEIKNFAYALVAIFFMLSVFIIASKFFEYGFLGVIAFLVIFSSTFLFIVLYLVRRFDVLKIKGR